MTPMPGKPAHPRTGGGRGRLTDAVGRATLRDRLYRALSAPGNGTFHADAICAQWMPFVLPIRAVFLPFRGNPIFLVYFLALGNFFNTIWISISKYM